MVAAFSTISLTELFISTNYVSKESDTTGQLNKDVNTKYFNFFAGDDRKGYMTDVGVTHGENQKDSIKS